MELPGFECYCLEDTDRGLESDMRIEQILAMKIYGKTAIPKGKYEVVISYSERFKKMLPLLLNVPGFEGIRIHPGNTESDTEGCLLPGLDRSFDSVLESRKAFSSVMASILQYLKTEKVYLEIS